MEKLPQETTIKERAYASESAGTLLSPHPSSSSQTRSVHESEPGDFRVCLFFNHEEGPVGYSIYSVDVRDVGGYDGSQQDLQQPKLRPLIELASEVYPKGMGVFAVGSRIYLVGGEIVPPRKKYGKTHALTDSVYMIDTAAPLPLRVVTPPQSRMNGGKTMPTVDHVNGLVYVLSCIPPFYTQFNKKNVFFESFDPNTDKWSPLPNPPFFNFVDDRAEGGLVVSHSVVGSTILFCTYLKNFVYAFHLELNTWESIEIGQEHWSHFPFPSESVLLSDSVWAALGGRPLSSCCLISELGFIQKEVDDLGIVLAPHPCLDYLVYCHLLRSKNGWLCVVTFGLDDEHDNGGKPSVLATVFRLVKKRTDTAYFYEVFHWPAHRRYPSLEEGVPNPEKVVGEIPVFGAVDLRCSMFNVEVNHFNEMSGLAACFLL
ncbi:hypothetical protein RHSIM_Rhsim04G0245000 [Rhododendron simsii]|uniref:Uncharacterized protein n=1 Tax=Rhododendron simsii TaxID=118357 RepID=A0A834H0J4_RHOSS|nr:hypothetical protein RHSIM_Rhsim04G0245000 [Rhododendron simsii]